MENYQAIHADYNGPVVTLWLSRPEVHNALNEVMIREITRFFSGLETLGEIRAVVIRGRGASFCSGADLNWMQNAFTLSPGENFKESEELSAMFRAIFESSKIVIAAVHGNIYGGGNGLVAVCDHACCLSDARFSLSETRIGMAAVSITPYLLQKVAASDLRELVFSARTFSGEEAVKYRLVNQSFPTQDAMDQHVKSFIDQVVANGPKALATSKRLINQLTMQQLHGLMGQLPGLLAQIRVSQEAREGFSAFLEKRKPKW
jgi:methylglutaconyl-CoA hydratase